MIPKIIISFFTISVFLSCNFSEGKKGNVETLPYKLNYIDTLMGDGCSEAYTFQSDKLEDGKFIFSSDKIKNANIKIDNKSIELKIDTTYSINEKIWIKVFKSKSCTVEVRITDIKQTGDEVWYEKGTLEVKLEGQPKYKVKIHGESGC